MPQQKLHVYCLPYWVDENGSYEVLLGKKKVFSSVDGFILNNPGQYVIVGGKHEKEHQTFKNTAVLEFAEETGIVINKDDLDKRVLRTKNFYVYFYQVKNKDKFSHINKNSEEFDRRYQELQTLEWFYIEDAMTLMRNEFNENIVIDNKQGIDTFNKFLDLVKTKKLRIGYIMRYLKKLNYNNVYILEDIHYHGANTKYYNEFKGLFFKILKEHSYTDWFQQGCEFLMS